MEIRFREPVQARLHEIQSEHYETIIREKELLENQVEADLYIENKILDKDISLDEVNRTFKNAKKGKTVGIDRIPNANLKH